jgi:hypothetical protein
MKRILILLPLLALAGASLAADMPRASTPIRPINDCIKTDQINEWYIVDARTALVRTGPKRYLVKLKADCPRLGIGMPGLRFRVSESNKAIASDRICGDLGEMVSARDQSPCAIASVSKIDKAQFETMSEHSARHSGAEPTGHEP